MLNVAAARNIAITADLSTSTGNIVLDADNGFQQTGNFIGVNISGAGVDVTTAGGNITIDGRGGDAAGGNQIGIQVSGGAKVQAGNNGATLGTVTITGTGGGTTGNTNYGVYVTGANSLITSSGGLVAVTGTGGGSGTSQFNSGVFVSVDGQISAGGTVTVTGTAGIGANSLGINLFEKGRQIFWRSFFVSMDASADFRFLSKCFGILKGGVIVLFLDIALPPYGVQSAVN